MIWTSVVKFHLKVKSIRRAPARQVLDSTLCPAWVKAHCEVTSIILSLNCWFNRGIHQKRHYRTGISCQRTELLFCCPQITLHHNMVSSIEQLWVHGGHVSRAFKKLPTTKRPSCFSTMFFICWRNMLSSSTISDYLLALIFRISKTWWYMWCNDPLGTCFLQKLWGMGIIISSCRHIPDYTNPLQYVLPWYDGFQFICLGCNFILNACKRYRWNREGTSFVIGRYI